ncbi:MlaD family protein [Consotaella salsifontis]|uniref:Phospholipid/cholesterol/gamma-HCH transport system substrate-binding protein n=1 Tax=Consotaella salsifontis TaxID=1365950 RepID=A0A1T4P770_9HYPH|nr:MlaD family protein [Consotaella salsifontis]SJZ87251.1 phospholipid/cholesterol/gamma-HCH transport system substrate-binding protein [Consotaella salsifontis]
METRANYILVGIFTLVVLAVGFGFVYWSATYSESGKQVPLLVRIEGSVTGLAQGSQVLFNGLRVGDVRQLRIDGNNPRVVIATTMVDSSIPITRSTQATIGFQGLTGIAFIELKGGDVSEQNIITEARQQGALPIIRANPSDVTDILATARDIAERADNILSQFEKIVDDAGPSVRVTLANVADTSENVKKFTASLANNADQVDEFLASVGNLAQTANGVAEKLPPLIDSAQGVLSAVDPAAVHSTVADVAATMKTLREQSNNIAGVVQNASRVADTLGQVANSIAGNLDGVNKLLADLGPFADSAKSVASRADTALESANRLLASVDSEKISGTVDSISKAATDISDVTAGVRARKDDIDAAISAAINTTRNLDQISGAVAAKREAIDAFIDRLGPIAANVDQASTRLNDALESANRVIAAIDENKVAATVDDVSGIAANLNAKSAEIGEIVDGVNVAVRTFDTTLTGFNGTRLRVDDLLAAVDPDTVNKAVENVSSATENVKNAADSIAGVADTIGSHREDIDTIITNVKSISAKIDNASNRLDGLLASLDGLLSGGEGEGLSGDVRSTLAAIRETALSLKAQIAPIAGNLQTFTGSGLREVQGMAREVTRSVGRIEDAITGLSQNPSRILNGGDQVKQYDGRTRR